MKKGILIICTALLLLSGLVVFEQSKFNDGKFHMVFCDVGQGDAIFIRTPNGKNILIDGGPDRKVLNCLADHMPFWQRRIDLMVLTHPHADHFVGMFYVLERYDVAQFATEKLENHSGEFKEFKKILIDHQVPVQYVSEGDKWTVAGDKNGDVVLSVLGPTKEFLQQTSPSGNIADSKEFASLVLKVSYSGGSFQAILTGDTQVGELGDIAKNLRSEGGRIDILQAPHHGSRTGLTKDIVQKIDPRLVIVSVGAKNRYKHPSKQILDLLKAAKVPIMRTDELGDIAVVADNKGWNISK